MSKPVPRKIRYGGEVYALADAEVDLKDPDVAEVVKMVLGAAGITVEQICTLGDNLRHLCEAEASVENEEDGGDDE